MSAPALVVILPNKRYKRFSGRTLTHHVETDRDLTAEEVEVFRVRPDDCVEPVEGNVA